MIVKGTTRTGIYVKGKVKSINGDFYVVECEYTEKEYLVPKDQAEEVKE